MLVRITNSCQMQCSHCLVEATPDGEHMTPETFVKTVLFLRKQLMPLMLMSGGEPTDHPDVISFIELALANGIETLLLSNGEFLYGDEDRRDRILELVYGLQVTNDPRFYPRYVERYEHPKVSWETRIRTVTPHGRAVTNGLAEGGRAPDCFNLRSITRTLGNFQAARLQLLARGKLCTPSVNIDGSISAGESTSCKKIGYVTDDDATITLNLKHMRCSRCGLSGNLDRTHLKAIGETPIRTPGED